jgi:hypothetical protein
MKNYAPKDKELAERKTLLRAWKRFHRDECEAVCAGPHGAVLSELLRMVENLQNVQPSQLIGFVGSIDWASINYATRLTVLHELNTAITKVREKRGLEPIDDPLPRQPDSPFRIIKAILFPHVADVAPAEAQLGSNTETPSKTGHVA